MQKSSSQSVPGIASAQVLCIEARYFVTFGILWPRLKPLTREPGVERNLYRRGGGGRSGWDCLRERVGGGGISAQDMGANSWVHVDGGGVGGVSCFSGLRGD